MKRWYEFSFARFWAMVVKEFIQMRRDRLTFGMMVPASCCFSSILFGYAINSDPKQLPSVVLLADNGPQGRTLLYAIQNSGYFHFVRQVKTETEGRDAVRQGRSPIRHKHSGEFQSKTFSGAKAGDSRGGGCNRSRHHQQCHQFLSPPC